MDINHTNAAVLEGKRLAAKDHQTNTFLKGMNTDISDALLSSELYRYAENVRIITNVDNNSGELRIVDGTTEIRKIYNEESEDENDENSEELSIHLPPDDENEVDDVNGENPAKILATNSIRDICVYIVKTIHEVDGVDKDCWYVYRMIGTEENPTRVFGPCFEPIWTEPFQYKKEINTVLRYESEDNIKLYITDSTEKHSLMVLNVAPGKEYANNETFEDVFGYLNLLLPSLVVNISANSGNLIAGKVLYAYRLYLKYGSATLISVLSLPLSLYKNSYSGYASEKHTGRAVDIVYPTINNQKLNYIQIYRISYVLNGQAPKIALIKDEPVAFGSTIDTGADIEEIAVNDFLSIINSQMFPKHIESKGDYLFAANLKYQEDSVNDLFTKFDARAYSCGNYKIVNGEEVPILDVNNLSDTSLLDNLNTSDLKHYAFPDGSTNYTYNPEHWKDIFIRINPAENNNSREISIRIEPDPDFHGEHYDPYDDDHGLLDDDVPGEGGVNTEINTEYTVNGYGKCICWKFVYNNLITMRPYNQGSMLYLKSTFRCGETYRFGIRLFDKKGRSSSVKWIADILIPPGGNMVLSDSNTVFRNIGIKFIPTPGSLALWENVAGYEIVRCERKLTDRKNLFLGLVGFPMETMRWKNNNNTYEPENTNLTCTPGFFSLDPAGAYSQGPWLGDPDDPNDDRLVFDRPGFGGYYLYCSDSNNWVFKVSRFAMTRNDFIMFACPEVCYLFDDVDNILSSYSDQLKALLVYKTYPIYVGHIVSDHYTTFLSNSTPSPGAHFAVLNRHKRVLITTPTLLGTNEFSVNYGLIPSGKFFNYFEPDYNTSHFVNCFANIGQEGFSNPEYSIKDSNIINSPKYSDYEENESFSFNNNTVTIGTKQFINWSTPLLNDLSGDGKLKIEVALNKADPSPFVLSGDYGEIYRRFEYPIGTGGRTILFKLDENSSNRIPISEQDTLHLPSITVVNIIKPTVPYGGYNENAIDNSSYISLGDYVYGSSSIEVFSGDTKNRIFTYNALHLPYSALLHIPYAMSTVYAIPIETDIDILALHGVLYNVESFYDTRIQDEACAFDTYVLEKDSYLYNTAYNSTPDIIEYTSNGDVYDTIKQFDTRVHYSELKTNNELIDSWTLFKTMNFIDVDSRYGLITDLKLFKDKLIFWQERATGILAVNERIMLNDLNDTLVVLGTGGVLERYDYFTTIFGQKPDQHARTVSNDSLYWWDGYNKEILVYQQKYDIVPLTTAKNVKNYINKNEESSVPFLTYDNKYCEVIANVVNNEAIVYNELILAFTSIYKFTPLFDFITNGNLLLTNENTIYNYNTYLDTDTVSLFDNDVTPRIDYVVNAHSTVNKSFDSQIFGGKFYGGSAQQENNNYERYLVKNEHNNNPLQNLKFKYYTPLKLYTEANGKNIVSNVEYDFRLNIPRNILNNGTIVERDKYKDWGDRLRGKTMRCTFESISSNRDFSLQFITTKFRLSWT